MRSKSPSCFNRKRPRIAPGPLNFITFVVTRLAMALARLSFCPGLVCGELLASPVRWRPGREQAVRSAPVAAGVCAELLAGLRGSAARLALAAKVASAECQTAFGGSEVREGVRSSVFESPFRSAVHSADA
jgi:hypothetical protein